MNQRFLPYGSWEGMAVGKILVQGVGIICPPGKPNSELCFVIFGCGLRLFINPSSFVGYGLRQFIDPYLLYRLWPRIIHRDLAPLWNMA